MPSKWTRRQLLVGAGRLGVSLAAFEAARKGADLWEQHRTWAAASEPNEAFLARNAARLATLELGASFAPEQWPDGRGRRQQATAGLALVLGDLNIHRVRLGIRWNRVHRESSPPDLRFYRPYLDRCLKGDVEVCLNAGPIRTFRWPEAHVPDSVLRSLSEVPAKGATITPSTPLGRAALAHQDALLEALRREYSDAQLAAIRSVQVENEPFYPLGEEDWLFGVPYLEAQARRLHAAFPDADLLVTTAGRLNINAARDFLVHLQAVEESFAGKLVSGFDFHYRTPNRDSWPVIRYFDQIAYAMPFVASAQENIDDSRRAAYRIEVTEGQMEPNGYFQQPGNSARDFRYMLQRCFDHVLDPREPGLIRLWGVEELVKKMHSGELTDEHRQIIALIQSINHRRPVEVGKGTN